VGVYGKGGHSRRGQVVVGWGQRGGPAGLAGATVFSFFTGVSKMFDSIKELASKVSKNAPGAGEGWPQADLRGSG